MMRIGRIGTLWLLTALLVLAACQAHDELDAEQQKPDGGLLPVYISIPAGDSYTTRALGDPGEGQAAVTLPTHLHLYVVTEPFEGDAVVACHHFELSAGDWELSATPWDGVQTQGDAYYRYKGDISIALPQHIGVAQRKAIRVYAVVTPVELTAMAADADVTTEQAVRQLKATFQPGSDGTYNYLKDVYASPADYMQNTRYYGSVANPATSSPRVDLMLYHLAAKVDVMWNVDPQVQSRVKLRKIEFRNLRKTNCRLFGYTTADASVVDGYTVSVPGMDESKQWYGRHYFYAIPCTQTEGGNTYYPVDMYLWQNTTDGAGHKETLQIPFNAFEGQSMAPWIREDVLIKKEL